MITHLQFVDNTILFNSYSKQEVVTMKRILRSFKLSPELKVNLPKSMTVGVGSLEKVV